MASHDERLDPVLLDADLPTGDAIPYPNYSQEDHETWSILYRRQRQRLPGRACDEFLEGLERMEFSEERIPALRDVAEVLKRKTGWNVARVPGLVEANAFFAQLSRRIFPSTDYIRRRDELDYTPAPDLFHDIFGHTPMITHPLFADFYEQLGHAASRAEGDDKLRLERFYWFTVEFGLIRTAGGLRIYGNGILSSASEVEACLADQVEKRPFVAEQLVEQDYDHRHLQPVLFVIDSWEQLAGEFNRWARQQGMLD